MQSPRLSVYLTLCFQIALGSACHKDREGGSSNQETVSPLAKEVVSTVNARPIYKESLLNVMKQTGFTKEQALRVLQDEALLAERAMVLGYRDAAPVVRGRERLLAQALLKKRVEAGTYPEEITAEKVEHAYQSQQSRFVKPETRASIHVLARFDKSSPPEVQQKALRFIQGAIAEFSKSKDINATLAQYEGVEGYPFQVHAEQLPSIDENAPVLESFKEALFSMKRPGLYPKPVRTVYGWHAIYLREIKKSSSVSLKKAAPELREEISTKERRARMESLLSELKKTYSVTMFESAIHKALAEDYESDQDG